MLWYLYFRKSGHCLGICICICILESQDLVDIVVVFVVGAQGNNRTEAKAVRVEYLVGVNKVKIYMLHSEIQCA